MIQAIIIPNSLQMALLWKPLKQLSNPEFRANMVNAKKMFSMK